MTLNIKPGPQKEFMEAEQPTYTYYPGERQVGKAHCISLIRGENKMKLGDTPPLVQEDVEYKIGSSLGWGEATHLTSGVSCGLYGLNNVFCKTGIPLATFLTEELVKRMLMDKLREKTNEAR